MAKINIERFRKITVKALEIDTREIGGTLFTYRVSDFHIRRNAELEKARQRAHLKVLKKSGLKMDANMAENQSKLVEKMMNEMSDSLLDMESKINDSFDIAVEFYKGFEGNLPTYEELEEKFKEYCPDVWETALSKFVNDVYTEFIAEVEAYNKFLEERTDEEKK